jgi:hypothetical protein
MANTVIQLKHSTLTGNVPSSLANGEISINSRDGKFFYSTPAGVVTTHYPYLGPAGLTTEIQFNDSGVLGSNSGLTFSKTTGVFTAPIVASSNNGNGTNFKIGDDAWIGDVNLADTLRIAGQQNVNNAYIVFGATNANTLGRAGSGPLTYTGAFTATGILSGSEISSTQSSGDEGGQINLALAATNTSLVGSVAIDIFQNRLRIFETSGTNRGVYIDMANGASTGVGTNLLSPSSSTDSFARTQANAAFIQANAAFLQANTPDYVANSAASYANSAFIVANNSLGIDTTQNTNITNVGTYANSAFLSANTPSHVANSAASYANSGFAVANSGASYANSAFTRANNSINANTGGTITGNLTISGNLTMTGAGNISTANISVTNNLTALSITTGSGIGGVILGANVIYSNVFVANSGGYIQFSDGSKQYIANAPSHVSTSAASYANGAFIQANSGFAVSNSAASYANSGFAVANSAASYANSAFIVANNSLGIDTTQNNNISSAASYANSAFLVANTPTNVANSAASYANSGFAVANSGSSYANSAYTRANNSVNANTGGVITGDITITGNLIIQGNTFTANAGVLTSNDTLFLLGTGNYTSDALDVGFAAHYNAGTNAHTGFIRDVGTKEWYIFKNYTPEVGANNNININDSSFTIDTLNANLKSTVITLKGIDLLPYVNNAYTAANTADTKAVNSGLYANAAFLVANTPTHVANSAASYANSGFAVANSGASYANSAFIVANNSLGIDLTQNTNITNAGTYANSAFLAANTPSNVANSAASYANAAFAKANTASGASASGYLANSVIVANSTGFLSNTSNLLFIQSNNTLQIATVPVATLGDVLALSIALG